ncbi:MAG: serine/threonine-protein kinase [Vicinamibacterales bacterium]|nr:serine/threonine-protein kinase [Vicinamibacterales bacterium]
MEPPLDPERWRRVSSVLDAVLDAPVEQRPAVLDALCAGDAGLRGEVESLLRAGDAAGDLLETPAAYRARSIGTAPADAASERVAARLEGQRLGPYRLRAKIGEGGMGAVYVADRTDGQFDHQVAIKLLPAGAHGEAWRQRFLQERQILARLEHPGIARLLDGGVTSEGLPYFAMEFVDGEPITAHCARLALPVRARLQLFLQVCEAVEYAHRNLVVHRDLKPSNVFVDRAGRIRLLDFGIAKWLGEETDASLTVAHRGAGPLTPQYAAPEQLLGEPITTGTDVYALGVMLFELLTGALPHEATGRSLRQLERAILGDDPPPPSARVRLETGLGASSLDAWRAQVRGDLDQIVLKAMRKEPAARYASVEMLAADVRRHLADYPVLACGDARAYRARKFLARHRLAVAAAALVALSTAAGVGGTVWQARKARAEADRARAVQDFVVSLFRTTEPGAGAQSRPVGDLLAQGEARIDTELTQQPAVQVELWRTVAEVQRQLGDYERAERLLRKATERLEQATPPDPLELARTQFQLAAVLNDHFRPDESARVAQPAIPVLERHLGPSSEEMGDAYDLLGSLRYQQGDYAEAERLRTQARDVYRRSLGERSRKVADIDNNLSVFYAERGRLDEAEAAGRRAVDVRRSLLGDDHPDTLLARYNLANALYQAGQWDEAAREFAAILPAQERVLGPAHPHVALTRRQVARIDTGLGRYDEAARLLDEVAQATVSSYGQDSVAAAYVSVQRSRLEQLRGRFDDAVRLGREAVAVLERVSGADHPDTAWARMNLADRAIDAGRYEEAGALLDAAAAVFRRLDASADPYLPQALDLQGVLLARQGHRDQARDHFERAVETFGDDPSRRLDAAPARWHLAAVLSGPAALERRARLFDAALTALRQGLPPAHTTTTEALLGYGAFLAESGRLVEAEPLLRESFEARRRTLGEDNVLTAEAAAALARCLSAMGRHDESRRLRQAAVPVLSAHPHRQPWWDASALDGASPGLAVAQIQKP